MRKVISLLLCIVLVFSFCGCFSIKSNNVITIDMSSIGLGKYYFTQLKDLIKEELGYDVRFIYQYSSDTTNATMLRMKNDDLSADIVLSGSAFDDECLKNTCVNFMEVSNITQSFSYGKIKENTADDGGVYKLPFLSKLIGVTYNKTLLAENGWEIPSNFEDMVNLKKQCDAKGINFAITDVANYNNISGYGFNWLFHLMGAQWLSGIEGSQWFDEYIAGKTDISEFKTQAEYFKKYYEAGLFGKICTGSNGTEEYQKTRSLFHYELTNSTYKELRKDTTGRIYGAEYDEGGNVKAIESDQGLYIKNGDNFVVYDSKNVSHNNQQRYDIPGASIDEFAAIPWISEDGNNNRYTCYDCMYVMVNKKVINNDKKEKINKILELLISEKASNLFLDTSHDGYVSVNNFKASSDRTYVNYIDKVMGGYIQPWYYILVKPDFLNQVGLKVNSYLMKEASFDDVMNTIEESNNSSLAGESKVIVTADDEFSYEELAKLEAICGANSLSEVLSQKGLEEEVSVSLMPYTKNTGDMALWSNSCLGLVSVKLYKGDLTDTYLNTIIPANANTPFGVKLTGSEIKELVNTKLDRSGENTYSSEYGPYPYACVTKNNIKLEDNTTYVVAVNKISVNEDVYNKWVSDGKILLDSDGKQIVGNLKNGLLKYFEEKKNISSENILW